MNTEDAYAAAWQARDWDEVERLQDREGGTANDTALQEQIAAALSASVGGWNQNTAIIQRSAAAMLPIIRAEVARAQAQALRDAADGMAWENDAEHLLEVADEIEKEQNDGR